MLILDLCGGSGSWSKAYSNAGYNVRVIDWQNGYDVRLLDYIGTDKVHGVLAAPPCTDLASSGARWWNAKGQEVLLSALAIADACVRIAVLHKPKWWCLENPVGRLGRFYGPPRLIFNPCDYGDPYTKKTLLWGDFNIPEKKPVAPLEGSKFHKFPETKDRSKLRSITPGGFAQAFFAANP